MELTFTNFRGDMVSLVNNPYFDLVNIDGQTSAMTDISSLIIGGIDGDIANNIHAQPRTIMLDFRIKHTANVEDAKRAILHVVKLKKSGTLTWNQNNRQIQISGIVESVDMPRWNEAIQMQISLHCEQPFWEDIEAVFQLINEAINLHYFTDEPSDMLFFPDEGIPFGEYDLSRTRTFYNNGDVAVGMDIEIIAFDTVTNPILYDIDGNFFGIGYGTGNKQVVMHEGDTISISTHKGHKSVKLNGESIISKIKARSTWLQLEAGENIFSIDSEETSTENMTFILSYKQRYI